MRGVTKIVSKKKTLNNFFFFFFLKFQFFLFLLFFSNFSKIIFNYIFFPVFSFFFFLKNFFFFKKLFFFQNQVKLKIRKKKAKRLFFLKKRIKKKKQRRTLFNANNVFKLFSRINQRFKIRYSFKDNIFLESEITKDPNIPSKLKNVFFRRDNYFFYKNKSTIFDNISILFENFFLNNFTFTYKKNKYCVYRNFFFLFFKYVLNNYNLYNNFFVFNIVFIYTYFFFKKKKISISAFLKKINNNNLYIILYVYFFIGKKYILKNKSKRGKTLFRGIRPSLPRRVMYHYVTNLVPNPEFNFNEKFTNTNAIILANSNFFKNKRAKNKKIMPSEKYIFTKYTNNFSYPKKTKKKLFKKISFFNLKKIKLFNYKKYKSLKQKKKKNKALTYKNIKHFAKNYSIAHETGTVITFISSYFRFFFKHFFYTMFANLRFSKINKFDIFNITSILFLPDFFLYKFRRNIRFFEKNSNYKYNNLTPMFVLNLKLKIKKIKIKPRNTNIFLWYLLNFCESKLRKPVRLKVSYVRRSLNNAFFKEIYVKTYRRYRFYTFRFKRGFFLSEIIRILIISIASKDATLFMNWFTWTLIHLPYRNVKGFLSFLKKILKKFLLPKLRKVFKIRGFKFDIRGKVGVSGDAKKRHTLISWGQSSFSEKRLRMSFKQGLVYTKTGVMGVTVIIFF